MALTKEAIWAVADRLDAAGKPPTLAAVRKALGSGSFTTISEAMREWREQKKEKPEVDRAAPPVPPELDEALRRFADVVWVKAAEIAGSELQRLAGEYEQARQEWAREKQELEALADDLANALDECQAKCSEAESAHAELAQRFVERDVEMLALKERVGDYEARLDELRQENQRLHDLLRQMAASRAESDRQQP